MPDWLEKESPKLARMFDHVKESCEKNGNSDNCNQYAMGVVNKYRSIRGIQRARFTQKTLIYMGVLKR